MPLINWLSCLNRCVQSLPESGVLILTKLLTYYAVGCMRKRNQIMKDNLNQVFGDTISFHRRREIIFRSWHNLIQLGITLLRFPRHGKSYLSHMEIHHPEAVTASHHQGRGVILIAPHLGNFFLGAAALAQMFPVSVVVRFPKDESLRQILQCSFDAMGFQTIDRKGALYRVVSALRQNRLVIFALDQHAASEAIWVDFFGRPAGTFAAPAQLALRGNIPVHWIYMHTLPDGRNEGIISPPLPLIHTGDDHQDVFLNTTLFIKKIEAVIRHDPDTWMWMHRRWKAPSIPTAAWESKPSARTESSVSSLKNIETPLSLS